MKLNDNLKKGDIMKNQEAWDFKDSIGAAKDGTGLAEIMEI